MKESKLPHIGAMITIFAFIYMIGVLVMQAIPMNLTTWILVTLLDAVIAWTMWKTNDESKWMMTVFTAGAASIAVIALVQFLSGKTAWKLEAKDMFTLICFVAAFIAMRKSTTKEAAVNYGSTAMFITLIPTIVDTWREPSIQNPWFWAACAIGWVFTLLGTQKGLAKRYTPYGGLILNGHIAALAIADFLGKSL